MKSLVIGILLLAAVSATGYWLTQCPCEDVPGAWLSGDVEKAAVEDWTFANDVGFCQLEVPSLIPHSVTLNCMSTNELLYISCARCEGKHWSTIALESHRGRIRIGESIYPVSLARVTDSSELDVAWRARALKMAALRGDDPANGPPSPRPDHWWSFRLASPG